MPCSASAIRSWMQSSAYGSRPTATVICETTPTCESPWGDQEKSRFYPSSPACIMSPTTIRWSSLRDRGPDWLLPAQFDLAPESASVLLSFRGVGEVSASVLIDNRPWVRTWANRSVYVHPYATPYRHEGARVEHHEVRDAHSGDHHDHRLIHIRCT